MPPGITKCATGEGYVLQTEVSAKCCSRVQRSCSMPKYVALTAMASCLPCRNGAAWKLPVMMLEIVPCGVQTGGAQTAEDQVRLYLAQPNIPLSESPTAWWRDNARLHTRRWLVSHKASSVCRPPLYRASGCAAQPGSYTDRRNRLKPERVEMLLFIRHNIKFE